MISEVVWPMRPTKFRLVVETVRSPSAITPMCPPRQGPQVGVDTAAPASMKVWIRPSSMAWRTIAWVAGIIESAATSTEEIGNPVYPPARRKLAEHGIDCAGKTSRQLKNSDYDAFDLLIGMDRANLRNMHRICGGDFAGKLHLLMDYTDHPGDVADPWYTDDFETTWRDVLAGCQGLLRQLSKGLE